MINPARSSLKAFATGIVFSLTAPVSAQTDIFAACFEKAPSMGTLEAAFLSKGWQPVTDPTDTIIAHLAWMGMPQYFNGDSGGASVQSVLEIKQKTARGVFRKKDIASAKTRVFTRKSGAKDEAALVTWLQATHYVTDVRCTFSLQASSFGELPEVLSQSDGFSSLPGQTPQIAGATTSLRQTILNRKTLGSDLKTSVPADVIVETYLSYRAKDN